MHLFGLNVTYFEIKATDGLSTCIFSSSKPELFSITIRHLQATNPWSLFLVRCALSLRMLHHSFISYADNSISVHQNSELFFICYNMQNFEMAIPYVAWLREYTNVLRYVVDIKH